MNGLKLTFGWCLLVGCGNEPGRVDVAPFGEFIETYCPSSGNELLSSSDRTPTGEAHGYGIRARQTGWTDAEADLQVIEWDLSAVVEVRLAFVEERFVGLEDLLRTSDAWSTYPDEFEALAQTGLDLPGCDGLGIEGPTTVRVEIEGVQHTFEGELGFALGDGTVTSSADTGYILLNSSGTELVPLAFVTEGVDWTAL